MKKSLMVLAALAVSGTASAAPFVWPQAWTSNPPSEVQTGGTFRDYVLSDHKTLNPFTTAESGNIPGQISAGGLFRLDPVKKQYIPYMAESYTTSPNGLVWTMKVRSGMKWSDGKPIVADDFITTFRIETDEKVGSNSYDSWFVNDKPIKVAKVGTDQVQVTFPTRVADAIEIAAISPQPTHVFMPVYTAKGAEGIKAMWTLNEPAANVISSGAFKFAGYRPGERASFVKNPFFGEWNKDSAGKPLPYLDGYTQTVTKDLNAAFAQFLAGQLDSFSPRNADDLAQIKRAIDAGNLKAQLRPNVSPQASSLWITFNWNQASNPTKQALFRNPDFRRAMSHIANRQAMIDLVLGGLGTPAYTGVYAIFKDWVSTSAKKYDYNLEAASKLLAQVGYSKKNADGWLVDRNGKVLEFDLATNAGNNQREQAAKIFVDEAKKVGVKVNFKPIDFNTLVSQLLSKGDDRKWDAILLGLSGSSIIYPLGDNVEPCGTNLHAFNASGKCLAPWETQVTALFARGKQELDTAKRQAIAKQIQNIQSENQAFIYLFSPNAHQAWNDRVQGEYPAGVADAYVGSRTLVLTWIKQ